MSLGVAFVGFMFLFFIVFCLYFTWNGFFSVGENKSTNSTESLEDSPEWRAFLDRRIEIENDLALDDAGKRTLIEHWQVMAAESKPHMAASALTPHSLPFRAKPAVLPVAVGGALVLALAFTYAIGAIHPGAFKWPKPDTLTAAPSVDQAVVASAGHPGDGASLKDRLAGLQTRLAQHPDDLRGWVLLARTHASMSNYAESVQALKAALTLTPGHPDILADLADMTAMAQGRTLKGEPEQYIAAALQSDPRHEKALALAASAAEQTGDTDKAQVYWQLLSQVQQASLKGPAQQPPENVLTTVTVNVPQKALHTMNPDSALFVYLKAQQGPGMPLAVVRVPAGQLQPGEQVVRVGPGDFIQEGAIGSLPETLYFQARLSIQGMAQTSTGDIESNWVAVQLNQLKAGLELNMPEGSAR